MNPSPTTTSRRGDTAGATRRLGIGLLAIPLALGALAIGSCDPGRPVRPERASAALVDVAGSPIGSATFTERSDGKVDVKVHVTGLAPGQHGMHVHNVGSCAQGASAFAGAGSHHNPGAATHGHHAGDLPNLIVDGDGVGHLATTTNTLTLSAGSTSVFDADGSALIIHLAQDDMVTDPTGNSGVRIACGVLTSE